MIHGIADHILSRKERHSGLNGADSRKSKGDSQRVDSDVATSSTQLADWSPLPRRAPRISVVVVLGENHFVSPDVLCEQLRGSGAQGVDVLIACAGQPANLAALQRCVSDAQFLLAPAGTSLEDLRELAMARAPGDIVTLLSGALLHAPEMSERQLFGTS